METKVEYLVTIEPHQTESAFHCWGEGYQVLAKVKSGDREFAVVSNGEMRINLTDGSVIRYTDDLESAGIKTDRDIHSLMKQACINLGYEIWHMNNWFEVYNDDIPDGVVCDTLDDAIQTAIAILEEGERG